MPTRTTFSLLLNLLVLAIAVFFLVTPSPTFAAAIEKVLYSFCSASGCADGSGPSSGPIFDAAGNLYGTTYAGGANNSGTVFQLTPGAGGTWTETVLYSFCSSTQCTDGAGPSGGLIFDAAGNLYGTTQAGGAFGPNCGRFTSGCGTVFMLTPTGSGTWIETVLHSFNDNGKDGVVPFAGLIFDAKNRLYGTTSSGGANKAPVCGGDGCGTVFELKTGAGGKWTETVLHSFCHVDGCAGDGFQPLAGLILDKAGNLYGTTNLGIPTGRCHGGAGCGTVFELMPRTDGEWKEKVLHSFNVDDGKNPQAGLILDAAGNLYGATATVGTVFELIKKDDWAGKVLHRFGKGNDGANPYGTPIFDAAGNLYGTTYDGGTNKCSPDGVGCGTVFQLSQGGNGTWTESILYSFQNNGEDGIWPHANLILDSVGNLYSTTGAGGTGPCEDQYGDEIGCGTVFEITP